MDALHGDIGNVASGDVLVMLSKSGETNELTTLLPYAKAKGAFVIACTDNEKSTLAVKSDMHVYLPSDGEVTPFPDDDELGNNAHTEQSTHTETMQNNQKINAKGPPVTYTALQLLFGDTCAVYLMELKGLTQNQYVLNHPAGRIGKRLVLKVSDVMKDWKELPLARPEMNGMEALVQMAGTSKGCGCLLVVDDSRKLLGTFSDADLRRALTKDGELVLKKTVSQLMNFEKEYPRTTTSSAMAFDAHLTMEHGNTVEYLPVVSEDGAKTLVGLVTMRGLAECGM